MNESTETLNHEVVQQLYRRSTTIGALAAAIAKAQASMGSVTKKKQNTEGGRYWYADLAAVLDVTSAFQEHGIAVLQFPTSSGHGMVSVSTLLILGEEWIESELSLVSMRTIRGGEQIPWLDPQGTGSGITYARKYAMLAIAALAPEDDDGLRASKQYTNSRNEAAAQWQDRQAEKQKPGVYGQRAAAPVAHDAEFTDVPPASGSGPKAVVEPQGKPTAAAKEKRQETPQPDISNLKGDFSTMYGDMRTLVLENPSKSGSNNIELGEAYVRLAGILDRDVAKGKFEEIRNAIIPGPKSRAYMPGANWEALYFIHAVLLAIQTASEKAPG